MSYEKFNVTMYGSAPWGFRLAGGRDFNESITVSRVTPGSKASESGMSAGDIVVNIDGKDATNMSHLDAQNSIKAAGAGGQLNLTLMRNSSFSRQGNPVLQGTPSNTATVAHLQYNSPANLYSPGNIYETFKGQTQGLVTDVQFVGLPGGQTAAPPQPSGNSGQQDIRQSATYRAIYDQDKEYHPPQPLDSPPINQFPGSHAAQSRSFRMLQQSLDSSPQQSDGGAERAPYARPAPALSTAIPQRPSGNTPSFRPVDAPQQMGYRPPSAVQNPPYQPVGGPHARQPDYNQYRPSQPSGPNYNTPSFSPPSSKNYGPSAIAPKPFSQISPRKPQYSDAPAQPSIQPYSPSGGDSKPQGLLQPVGGPVRAAPGVTPPTGGRLPVCQTCNDTIRGPFVTALGKSWHPQHFTCVMCNVSLQDLGFVEENGQLLCERDYNDNFAPLCSKCGQRITEDVLHALERTWHTYCFVCNHCKQPFGNAGFHLEDNLPYCETDWNNLFTSKCNACNQAIQAGHRWLEALNANWHADCFKCCVCYKRLEGESFFSKGGRPFCKEHNR